MDSLIAYCPDVRLPVARQTLFHVVWFGGAPRAAVLQPSGMDLYMASEKYQEYLTSEAWQKKRMQRLAISKFRCAACGSRDGLEVHHLTYARIFDEDMADLLPLCGLHHKAAEEMVANGKLPRTDDVLFLATETIRLIADPCRSPRLRTVRLGQRDVEIRNRVQEELLSAAWFLEMMRHPRHEFKYAIRKRFEGHPLRNKMLANAFIVYDRTGKRARRQISRRSANPVTRKTHKPETA